MSLFLYYLKPRTYVWGNNTECWIDPFISPTAITLQDPIIVSMAFPFHSNPQKPLCISSLYGTTPFIFAVQEARPASA